MVESPAPVPGSSYASVIKPTTKHVSFTDATTQTDPVTILDSEESNEIQMSASNNVTKTTTTQTKTPTTAEQTKTTPPLNQGSQASKEHGWLAGCFGLNGPLRQYFSLYRAVSQREGERNEK